MECIICYEPVYKNELYDPECGCKYTAHAQCIHEWNGKCIICDKPPKPRLRREMICVAVCMFIILIIMGKTIF